MTTTSIRKCHQSPKKGKEDEKKEHNHEHNKIKKKKKTKKKSKEKEQQEQEQQQHFSSSPTKVVSPTTPQQGGEAILSSPSNEEIIKNTMKLLADDVILTSPYHKKNPCERPSLSYCVNDSANSDTTFKDCYRYETMEIESDDDDNDNDEEAKAGDGKNICRTPIILGEGAFAIVYRCTHLKNNKRYAVKEITNNDSYVGVNGNNIQTEVSSLRKLKDSPFIVPLFDAFIETNQSFMIMEEMVGGNLLERLCQKEYYTEKKAKKVSRTLLEAIRFCHQKGIVHRDVKPENILLMSQDSDTKIKLADFGCSKRIVRGVKSLRTLCGTKYYVAPEVLMVSSSSFSKDENDESDGYYYDERCDVWSVGVIVYVLLAGYQPFEGDDDEDTRQYIVDGDYEFHAKYWDVISDPPKKLIRGLLTVDPDDRLSIEEALDSDWLCYQKQNRRSAS